MLVFIAKDIVNTFCYLPEGIFIGLLLCLGVYICNWKRKKPRCYYAAVFFLGIYLKVLGVLVLWNRSPGSREGMTLALFGTMGKGAPFDAYVVENLLLFIPFGFLLPCIIQCMKKPAWCALAGLLCSMSIEILQFLTKVGYCQLDDVVMNTLGAVLGWALYKGARRCIKKLRGADSGC